MNTRRLTKKYKHKSRKSKRTRRRGRRKRNGKTRRSGRSGRRIMKGGVPSVSRASSRASARPLASLIFNQSLRTEEEKLFDSFFRNLKEEKENFEKTLCALYNIYNSLEPDKINQILRSSGFKIRYEKAFYFRKETTNIFDVKSSNLHANSKYILFLSYIFKKNLEGEFIRCNGIRQDFVYNKHTCQISLNWSSLCHFYKHCRSKLNVFR